MEENELQVSISPRENLFLETLQLMKWGSINSSIITMRASAQYKSLQLTLFILITTRLQSHSSIGWSILGQLKMRWKFSPQKWYLLLSFLKSVLPIFIIFLHKFYLKGCLGYCFGFKKIFLTEMSRELCGFFSNVIETCIVTRQKP